MLNLIERRFQETTEIYKRIYKNTEFLTTLKEISLAIIKAYQNGNKVLICGNGGSAADAQHITTELMGRFYFNRNPFPAICLNVNTSLITALANDFSYDEVFARQISGLAQEGDVFLGLSTSGSSKNIILATETALDYGMITIAFTGNTKGSLSDIVNYWLRVPTNDTPRIQEVHITAGHIMCELIEKELK